MGTVTIHEAKTDLSKLIAREAGEEIIIARGKEPVARLEAIASRKERTPGRLAGKFNLPDAFFFDPLPEEELRLWKSWKQRD